MKESEKLANLLKYLRDVESEYCYSQQRISELELLQTDYLHKLEFVARTTSERNKIATALKKCRIERRKVKESCELFRELVDFIYSNRSQIKKLETILGNVRKIEINQCSRMYKPRVMTEEEYIG